MYNVIMSLSDGTEKVVATVDDYKDDISYINASERKDAFILKDDLNVHIVYPDDSYTRYEKVFESEHDLMVAMLDNINAI